MWAISPIFAAGIYIEKRTGLLTLLIGIGLGMNIGLNFFLIPKLGIMGAAVATLFSYSFLFAAIISLSYLYLRIPIHLAPLAKYLGASVLMLVVLKAFAFEPNVLALLLQIILGGTVYGIVLWVIDKPFRHYMRFLFLRAVTLSNR